MDSGQQLTQAEIDAFMSGVMPGGFNVTACNGCGRVTKKLSFEGRGSLKMKVISMDGKITYRGKIVAGTTICLVCGFQEKSICSK